ncbi:tetratricopeptide repeat protein [Brachyspira murdochii]|uniref:tetratricopeptide repeat protein n=1 Tax=Brachyspira murdochii TaxID=84378 RepID=UPI0012F4B511
MKLNTNDTDAYNNKGFDKEQLGKYKDALKNYKKSLELNPNNNIVIENIKNIQDKYNLK